MTDRYIQPQLPALSCFRCIIHLCANLEEPSQSPSQPPKKEEREGERKEKDQKKREREGGENTRTKEQVRQTGKSRNQSLGSSVGTHPSHISNDRGRLLPICFDIPRPAQPVERRLRTIRVLKTLKSINIAEGAETGGREVSPGTRAAV